MNPVHDAAELLKFHPLVYTAIVYLCGHGGARILIYVSKKMPTLPPNAGFWTKWAYDIMKGASGLDPNAAIVSPGTLKALIDQK